MNSTDIPPRRARSAASSSTRATSERRVSARRGFPRKPWAPALRSSSSRLQPELTIRTGMPARSRSARRLASTSAPPSVGIERSSSTAWGCSRRIFSRASRPLTAVVSCVVAAQHGGLEGQDCFAVVDQQEVRQAQRHPFSPDLSVTCQGDGRVGVSNRKRFRPCAGQGFGMPISLRGRHFGFPPRCSVRREAGWLSCSVARLRAVRGLRQRSGR